MFGRQHRRRFKLKLVEIKKHFDRTLVSGSSRIDNRVDSVFRAPNGDEGFSLTTPPSSVARAGRSIAQREF